MNRAEIINKLIEKIGATSYLEIGVASGSTFDIIKCEKKVGVDPGLGSKATIFESSDEFFKKNKLYFDFIFIDGLHHSEQVYKDVKNSLLCLNENGYILCHDLLPPSEEYAMVPPVQNLWTGDCYKAWIRLRSEEPNLSMHTIDTDFGCGLISRGQQELISLPDQIKWSDFVENKDRWMNIISVEEFKEKFL